MTSPNTEVLKIFLSIPMTGRTEEQLNDAVAIEHNRLNNLFKKYKIEIHDGREVFKKSYTNNENFVSAIALLEKCDICAMAEAWPYSEGCKIEREIAVKFGKPIVITDTEYTPSFIKTYIVGKALSTKHSL